MKWNMVLMVIKVDLEDHHGRSMEWNIIIPILHNNYVNSTRFVYL